MNSPCLLEIAFYILMLLCLTPLLGHYMAIVFEDKNHALKKPFSWLEKIVYKICNINPMLSFDWKIYSWQLMIFNLIGFLFLFLLQINQGNLILNPNQVPNESWHLSLNTAASFVTNTNWQSYAGEGTISYLTNILGLTVQNFLSAATGIAVLLVLLRSVRNQSITEIGNFWVDLTRSIVYVLLPLSLIFSIFLMQQGVIQNLSTNLRINTYETSSIQVLPMGPAASQIAIKQLGSNGGGFFNTNSSHPFENPSPLSNFVEMLALLLLSSSLVYMSGLMLKSTRQGLVILSVMLIFLLTGIALSIYSEFFSASSFNIMEGKETRFGVVNSIIWSVATTASSNGSINCMLSSLSPLSGGISLFNIMLGEIIFGGVGAGMYGMFMFIFLTVFIAGLMVGRTPEFMGKKIEAKEIMLVVLALFLPNILILIGSSISIMLPEGLTSILNIGPHGLTEILYAFSSAAGNNGSAFAGLNANTPYYNIALALTMLIGRFGVIIPVLAIAGSISNKKTIPPSSGTLPTNSILFGLLLISVIIIIGGLTFLPVLILGPILEHLLMLRGNLF